MCDIHIPATWYPRPERGGVYRDLPRIYTGTLLRAVNVLTFDDRGGTPGQRPGAMQGGWKDPRSVSATPCLFHSRDRVVVVASSLNSGRFERSKKVLPRPRGRAFISLRIASRVSQNQERLKCTETDADIFAGALRYPLLLYFSSYSSSLTGDTRSGDAPEGS